MKNKKLNLVLLIMLMFFATACGSKEITTSNNQDQDNNQNPNHNQNSYDKIFDEVYFGDITIGSVTFNMASNEDQIKEKGMEKKIGIYKYEDEKTGSYISYQVQNFDNDLEIYFSTHNTLYQDLGCENCDNSMSNYVKLPKNITYDSTMNDVINAYGKPQPYEDDNEIYDQEEDGYQDIDDSYQYENNSLTGEKFGKIDCYSLRYRVENDNYAENHARFILDLYFDKETQKLYRVSYTIDIDN